jgi:hypothetical protein
MAINTKQVAGRRKLRFNSLDDILADLKDLEGQRLKTLGNWSVGQILVHLSVPMNGAIDGIKLPVPWYFRWIARLFKRKLLNGAMPPGFKLPKEAEDVMVPDDAPAEEGFAILRKAIARLKTEPHREPSPVFGPLTIEEYNTLMCRHCELHLSFIVPEG